MSQIANGRSDPMKTTDLRFSPLTYRLVWGSVIPVVTLVFAIVVALHGVNVLIEPLTFVPTVVSKYWLTVNTMLFLIGMFYELRNLAAYEEHWNWQERMASRGIFIIMGGSTLGLMPRAFGGLAEITIGTPVVTVGLLVFIYGVVSPPERFKDPEQGSTEGESLGVG